MKNTILSGAWAAVTVMLIARMKSQRWSLLVTINGGLAGMVGIFCFFKVGFLHSNLNYEELSALRHRMRAAPAARNVTRWS